MERRKKEIGIRKIHGAQSWYLMLLLTKDFVWLILIAFSITVPITYFKGTDWLNTFAYRITLDGTNYFLAAFALLGVGCLTVSYKAYKASSQNPVDTLRSE